MQPVKPPNPDGVYKLKGGGKESDLPFERVVKGMYIHHPIKGFVPVETSGFHTVMARIEASGTASRALHAACGFELVGVEREVGRKFNRWLDVAVMQRMVHHA